MIRTKLIAHVAVLWWLLVCPSRAGELEPFLTEGRIGVRIRNLEFPRTLAQDLASGLTNHVLAQLELRTGTQVAASSAVEVIVKYDLWDESFRVIMMVDGRRSSDQVYRSLPDVRALLTDLRVPGLFASSGHTADALVVRANVLLNPLDKERMERIREWVKENNTPIASGTGVSPRGSPAGVTASSALFNRIFEQYVSGKDLAAAWHESVASKPFKVDALPHDSSSP